MQISIADQLEKFSLLLNTPLEAGGYKLAETHFRLGKGLHAGIYYHLKKFYEIDKNCSLVASILASRIKISGNTTLVSNGAHTNLLLKQTASLLAEDKANEGFKINYAVAYHNKGENFRFQFENEFYENIIIILPAVNTLGRYIVFKKSFTAWLATQFQRERILIKPVIDPITYSTIYFESNIFSADILQHSFQEENRIFIRTINEKKGEIRYLLKLDCECQAEEACELCYFEKSENAEPTSERYFFPVNNASETPMLIFDTPKYGDRDNQPVNHPNFDEVFKMDGNLSPTYYGHTKFNELAFTYFVFPDRFYKPNKTGILDHFKKILEDKTADGQYQHITFITPRRDISSSFLEDFVYIFKASDLNFSIISYRPFDEYSENFKAFYGKSTPLTGDGEGKTLLIFFTDVIFDGSEFKELNSILKATDRAFNMCWSIIDRTDNISYPRIRNRLAAESDFCFYFKLNVPVQPKSNFINPIQKRLDKLRQAFSDCHLDALKLRVIKEILECEPKDILFVQSEKTASTRYFPFFDLSKDIVENTAIFNYYNSVYPKDAAMLLKLQLFHEASKEISLTNSVINLSELIKKVSESITTTFFKSNTADNSQEEKLLIRDNVIKLFSRSPFVSFEAIYRQIFEFCITELNRLVNKPLASSLISFSDYRSFKYFVRRSVELNSNYILSEKFVFFLKNVIFTRKFSDRANSFFEGLSFLKDATHVDGLLEQVNQNELYIHEQVNGLKYFLLYCYKELLIANPARAIILEDLINRPHLQPDGFNGVTVSLPDFVQDEFYALGRVLKSENIGILTDFKDWYFLNSSSPKGSIEDKKNYIFNNYLNTTSPVSHEHDFLLKFIKKSKHFDSPDEYAEIKNSISWMVAISDHLHKLGAENRSSVGLDKEIKNILGSLTQVFNYHNEEGKLVTPGYLLLVEYNQVGDKRFFYACSSNDDDYEDLNPAAGSFARYVYDGLLDERSGNLHTFIPLLRIGDGQEEKVISFTDNLFYSSVHDTPVILQNALQKDADRYHVINKAKMLEYFRLANISEEGGKVSNAPRGVLVLCSNDEPTVHNFKSFQNTEKLRLLLLIKEELLRYITTLVRTDAFIELLNSKQQVANSDALRHGLENYFTMIQKYVYGKRRSNMVQIIIDAITGQVLARFGSAVLSSSPDSKSLSSKDTIEITYKMFETRIKKLSRDRRIGDESINIIFEADKNAFPLVIEKVIFNVILTELIINMKRYHSKGGTRNNRFYKIAVSKNRWIFTNNTALTEYKQKQYGGLYMIKTILRVLNYIPCKPVIEHGRFYAIINLIKNKDEKNLYN